MRPLPFCNVKTKLLATLILDRITVLNDFTVQKDFDKYQCGFNKGHSTGFCAYSVKRSTEYQAYVNRGSHVFATFTDVSKAFDRVNYWKLSGQLLDDGVDR